MYLFKQTGSQRKLNSLAEQLSPKVRELQRELANQASTLKQERAQHSLALALNAAQNEFLEMIVQGAPLTVTLTKLMLLIESQSPGMTCSTLLLDESGMLIRPGAAPNLPQEYNDALDGTLIGPDVGSCGAAMFLKKQIVVTNLMKDPLWAPYRNLIAQHGYLACWSTPIFNKDVVLGAFAMYWREECSPGAHDDMLIAFATHIAGIAIERNRHELELARFRDSLQAQIKIRTTELTLANRKSEAANLALSKVNKELADTLNNLHLTQEDLVQKVKLASLGSLVDGISNELNKPIGNCILAISNLADRTRKTATLVEQGIKRSELENYFKDAVNSNDILYKSIHHAADLVTRFKQVSVDHNSSERRRFSVQEYISSVLGALQPTFQHSPFVINHNIQQGLVMDGFPGGFSQVITILVNNSMLHGFEGRTSGFITILAHAINDEQLEVVINDDGNGISPENQQHVFDPFFTTKRHSGSTGLGLHITHNIVTGLMGGHIKVQSELGIGTTFYLTLPFRAP